MRFLTDKPPELAMPLIVHHDGKRFILQDHNRQDVAYFHGPEARQHDLAVLFGEALCEAVNLRAQLLAAEKVIEAARGVRDMRCHNCADWEVMARGYLTQAIAIYDATKEPKP